MELAAFAAGVVLALVAALVAARLAPRAASAGELAAARSLGALEAGIERLARAHEALRSDLQVGREASQRDLADATEGLRGELGAARRTLGEVRALEEARGERLEDAARSLRRLEAVLAGSASRGGAGENLLGAALAQLPADLVERDAPFGSRQVEYALRLPGGRLLPIDSKWPSAGPLAELAETADPELRRRLAERVSRELGARSREMARYLDPERTLGMGLLVVPDAVHAFSLDAQIDAARDGIVIVPYSLALPYLLALLRLAGRFAPAGEDERAWQRLGELEQALRRMDDEVEQRLSQRPRRAARGAGGRPRRARGGARRAGAGGGAAPLELTSSSVRP
jgi:DNA recombination protein RmuC